LEPIFFVRLKTFPIPLFQHEKQCPLYFKKNRYLIELAELFLLVKKHTNHFIQERWHIFCVL